jgi:hypothetical protein
MTRLLIGNCFTDELAGDPVLLPPDHLQTAAASAQLLVWLAEDDDVLVLPEPPDPDLVEYVTGVTGTRASTLRVLVPPPGAAGTELLTADRLADPGFRAELQGVVDDTVDTVFGLTPDASVVALARSLGLAHAVAGSGFVGQGGGMFVNSKALFRMVAAGAGVPLPAGAVCTNPQDAEEAVMTLLDQGMPVMLKRDYACGGLGNELLTAAPGVRPVGAGRLVEVTDRGSVRAYLADRWDWLSNGRRYFVVVEQYVPDSRGIFVEFDITDDGAVFAEHGEMLSDPVAYAQVIPSPGLPDRALADLVAAGARLCESLRVLGYRGFFCADAIVTPTGEVLFTEYNGRVTGSTHIYRVVGRKIVGPDYGADRVLVEYTGWPVPSFREAAERLAGAGLAYDPATRTGAVLVKAYNRANGTVRYCAVAPDLAAADLLRAQVDDLFAGVPA